MTPAQSPSLGPEVSDFVVEGPDNRQNQVDSNITNESGINISTTLPLIMTEVKDDSDTKGGRPVGGIIDQQVLRDMVTRNLLCSVCQEVVIRAQSLNCSHVFCLHCIEQWLLLHNHCPICRETVGQRTAVLAVDNLVKQYFETQPQQDQEERIILVEARQQLFQQRVTAEAESGTALSAATGRGATFAENINDMLRGLIEEGTLQTVISDVIDDGCHASITLVRTHTIIEPTEEPEYGLRINFSRFRRDDMAADGRVEQELEEEDVVGEEGEEYFPRDEEENSHEDEGQRELGEDTEEEAIGTGSESEVRVSEVVGLSPVASIPRRSQRIRERLEAQGQGSILQGVDRPRNPTRIGTTRTPEVEEEEEEQEDNRRPGLRPRKRRKRI